MLLSPFANATWVGAFVYSNLIFDHMHITIAEDGQFSESTVLNIWENGLDFVTMSSEVKDADEFVIFWVKKPKDDIVKAWNPFHKQLIRSDERSFLSKNCAFASKHVFEDILGLRFLDTIVFGRAAGPIYLPEWENMLQLPDAVRKKLILKLIDCKIPYYTESDFKGKAKAWLASLPVPSNIDIAARKCQL